MRAQYITACALLLLATTALGCSGPPKAPETVYEEFHTALLRAGRGDPSGLSRAMTHLSRRNLDALAAEAEKVNSALPEGAPKVAPRQMLSVSAMKSDLAPTDLQVELISPTTLNLQVTIGNETTNVPMVKEGNDWKIDLVITGASTQSETAPVGSP